MLELKEALRHIMSHDTEEIMADRFVDDNSEDIKPWHEAWTVVKNFLRVGDTQCS